MILVSDQNQQNSPEESVISVRNVSKMYPLYKDPRDRLRQSLWYARPKFLRRSPPPEFYKEFWALRDVSFEVKKGEAVGIIGRNGSGKSTLLQIIAGTLTPSWGEVQVNGRVAALLELGSGFNPEFTGRENVYMNGAILGLSREEIDARFDDIAAFADIGQFMEQPVKLYSSGMAMRLAFAVQAFVPKQVLVVDEALAVGDVAFQRKCMRVIEEFQNQGGSILLVSHDIQMINRWCQRAVLLEAGQMLINDHSKQVTDIYQQILFSSNNQQRQILVENLLQATNSSPDFQLESLLTPESIAELTSQDQLAAQASYDPALQQPIETAYGNGRAEIVDAYVVDKHNRRMNVVVCGKRYQWCYRVAFAESTYDVHFGMTLKTIDGLIVSVASTLHDGIDIPFVEQGSVVDVTFNLAVNVVPGTYYLNCGVSAIEAGEFVYLHRRVDVAAIRVIPKDGRTIDGIAYLDHQITFRMMKEK